MFDVPIGYLKSNYTSNFLHLLKYTLYHTEVPTDKVPLHECIFVRTRLCYIIDWYYII